MYTRLLKAPEHTFFLLGPRGTGKTTWLRAALPGARWLDLVRNDTFLHLMRDPSYLRSWVEGGPEGWVVIDEVQRLPELLHEVHGLIAEHGRRYLFALSGSSARKLKRLDVDLLAGRAINRVFFPLMGAEMEFEFEEDRLLRFGTLPGVVSEPDFAVDILEAYAANYLKEEIQQEALVKDLGSFSRFLEVAAIMNGQVANVSGIARDAGVARPTVQRYFDVLTSTLIGTWLPAWRPRARVKEVAHPKFYFFDPGVVRALLHRLRDSVELAERGPLLETIVLHELRAYVAIANVGGQFSYWRTTAGREVDFLWARGPTTVGIEVKAAREWKPDFGGVLRELLSDGIIQRAFAVTLGTEVLRDGPLLVLPLREFMRRLHRGEILPPPVA